MKNIRNMQRYLKYLFRLVIIFPGSFFVGIGINQLGHWFGHRSLSQNEILFSGFAFILAFYIIPHTIFYLMAAKKTRKYFPVTNDVVAEHRNFFLENIDQEIIYLKQAVDVFRDSDMQDDYNLFLEGIQKLIEIKSCITGNEELQREHLICLNQIFNRGYFMKKL